MQLIGVVSDKCRISLNWLVFALAVGFPMLIHFIFSLKNQFARAFKSILPHGVHDAHMSSQ